MTERDLAEAYRQRFDRQLEAERRLDALLSGLSPSINMGEDSWLVAAAVPRLGKRSLTRPPRSSAIAAANGALGLIGEWTNSSEDDFYSLLRNLDQAALNPRRGLRRWVADTPAFNSTDTRSTSVHLELHDDGAMTFSVNTQNWYRAVIGNAYQVPIGMVESFALEFLALISAWGASSSGASSLALRLDTADSAVASALLDVRRVGGIVFGDFSEIQGSRRVLEVQTVYSEADYGIDQQAALRLAGLVSRDFVNQFGVDRSVLLPDPFVARSSSSRLN